MKLYTIILAAVSGVSIVYGKCTERRYPEPKRTPALYVYDPLQEKRYMLEQGHDGTMYICEQALFNTQGFITIPAIYCVPAQRLTIKNSDYIPYEAACWFNGNNLIICHHQDNTLSGFYGVRACHKDPPGDTIVLGQTENAYIIKDKGEAVCDT